MTAYELWEKPALARLPRSRLYSLEPHGLGTSHVESLTSYLRRLAAVHSVAISKLIKKEIIPLCRPGRAKKNMMDVHSRRLHSARELVLEVTWALQCLTGRPNLPFLTFVPWMDVTVFDEVLRSDRAWCAACLQEQRQAGLDISEPLLWALQPLEICPKHQQRLQNVCPHCHQTLAWLTAYSRPGYCSSCYAWLGIVPHPQELSPANLTDNERQWQQWIAEAVGNLLAAGPTLASLPSLEWLAAGLTNYCAQVAQGRLDQFVEILQAHQLQVSLIQLKGWLSGQSRPPFMSFLELCFCLRTEPLDLLTAETAVREPISLRTLTIGRSKPNQSPPDPEKIAQTLTAVLNDDDHPPPSLNQLCKQLGLANPHFLNKHFPQQATLIKDRYQAHIRARQEQRRQALRKKVRQAVSDIYAQGLDPSIGRLSGYLDKPRYILNQDVQADWQEARRELGLES